MRRGRTSNGVERALPGLGLALGALVALRVSPPLPPPGDVVPPFRDARDMGALVEHAMRPAASFAITSVVLGTVFSLALVFGVRWARGAIAARADGTWRRTPTPVASRKPVPSSQRAAPSVRTGLVATAAMFANMGFRHATDLEVRTAEGVTRLDLVGLVGATVVVVDVVHLPGTLAGHVDGGSWVHRRPAGSERAVPNPVRTATAKAAAVRAMTSPGTAVAGLAVLTGTATGPEIPGRLTSLSRLSAALTALERGGGSQSQGVREAFERLLGEARRPNVG